MIDKEPVQAPPLRREPFQKPRLTEQKLEYLDRLIKIDGQQTALVEQEEVESRIKRVCDSIEKDLGLNEVKGILIHSEPIDKETMERIKKSWAEQAENIMLFGDGDKSKGTPIGAVTGMYKREWTQPDE